MALPLGAGLDVDDRDPHGRRPTTVVPGTSDSVVGRLSTVEGCPPSPVRPVGRRAAVQTMLLVFALRRDARTRTRTNTGVHHKRASEL